MIPQPISHAFGLSTTALCKPIGTGHIHQTFLVEDTDKYFLQRSNIKIFTDPEAIATNNGTAVDYLAQHHPEYLFLTALRDKSGNELVYAEDGFPWRMYPKIAFRKEMYDALVEGYLSEMKCMMSAEEIKAISFAGQMMTYIMAIRFLADFLRGNTYYHITYPDQNLVRAKNQLTLLSFLCKNV